MIGNLLLWYVHFAHLYPLKYNKYNEFFDQIKVMFVTVLTEHKYVLMPKCISILSIINTVPIVFNHSSSVSIH